VEALVSARLERGFEFVELQLSQIGMRGHLCLAFSASCKQSIVTNRRRAPEIRIAVPLRRVLCF
jgi:hypothetical protein